MGRIKGHYEWDDDDLTPGRKKEGGLHQNRFDSEGNLKGSAPIRPEDEDDPEPLVATETVYIPVEERRRNQENDELAGFVAGVVAGLARRGLAAAAPIVARWSATPRSRPWSPSAPSFASAGSAEKPGR
jgi:hypothetical protein